MATTFDDPICTETMCPACDALLEVILESALPDALGVDARIEGKTVNEVSVDE